MRGMMAAEEGHLTAHSKMTPNGKRDKKKKKMMGPQLKLEIKY